MTKLIFCFDGAFNDSLDAGSFFSDSSISNILKLHTLFGGDLQNSRNLSTPDQHSFYYSGIGTRGSFLRKIVNSAFVPSFVDTSEIIDEAKNNLQKFKKSDEIYIFGFSLGAAIARKFAAKIREHNPAVESIKFLGVFDTVAAIRDSLDLRKDTYPASGILFENGTLGEHIQSAVHLVSIDEKRLAFQPTLFNFDKRIEEIWFAGVHSDIGGGYWFDGLSDITLEVMCNKAEKAGLTVLATDKINYASLHDNDEDAEEEGICLDDLEIHPIAKGVLHEQQRPGLAAKTLAPRLVRVNENDQESTKHSAIIHHTVHERFGQVTGYRPYALRNRKYRVIDKNGKIGKERLGIKGLRKKTLREYLPHSNT